MAVISIVVGGLLLGCMACIAMYGAMTLPSDARIPIHAGFRGYNNYMPKTAGLISWLAAGVLVYLLLILTSQGAIKPGNAGRTVASAVLVAALAVLAASQMGAIKAARGSTTGRSE